MQPDSSKHRIKAERNEQFADAIDVTDPIRESWAVVAAFYSAVHYMEQFFIDVTGRASEDHKDRNARFRSDPRVEPAWAAYSYLFNLSHQARYKCAALPANAYKMYAHPRLLRVKQQVDHELNIAAKVETGPPRKNTPDLGRPTPGTPIK